MLQVANLYTLILVIALLAAGIVLLSMGDTTWGAACLSAALGGLAIERPIQKPPAV